MRNRIRAVAASGSGKAGGDILRLLGVPIPLLVVLLPRQRVYLMELSGRLIR